MAHRPNADDPARGWWGHGRIFGGALVVVVSVISMGEVFRIGRYLNVLLGVGIAGYIWFTDYPSLGLALTSTIAGILIAALALPKGIQKEHYGGWDEYVR